jgi:hypothetical protein
MPSEPKAGAVIYALDLGRMSEFYTNVAGLRLTHAGEDNAILESNTFQLTIVRIPPDIAATIEIKTPPVRRKHQGCPQHGSPIWWEIGLQRARMGVPRPEGL